MGVHKMEQPSSLDEPLRLVHHHPGYIRAWAKAFVEVKEDSIVLTKVRSAVESTPGFVRWSHNPETGSIVVEYRPGSVNPDDLLGQVVTSAGFTGIQEVIHNSDHRKRLVKGLLDGVQDVNSIFYEATGKRADLRELIPVALLLNSAVSFVLGEKRGRLPSWDSSLYKGYKIFTQFHRSEVRKREKRERKREKQADEQPQESMVSRYEAHA